MESKIIKAIVYKDRAMVTREQVIDVKKDDCSLLFENIPVTAERDSIRIKAIGSGEIRLNGIQVREDFSEKAGNAEIQSLRDELLALNDSLYNLEKKKALIAGQEAFIHSLKAKLSDEIMIDFNFKKAKASEVEQTIQKCLAEELSLIEKRHLLEIEKKPILEKKSVVESKLNEIQAGAHKSILNAEVQFECLKEGEVRFYFSCLIPNCSWVPYYDVRMMLEKKELELTFYGEVSQVSGEDWENIDLYLSTANPALPADLPELDPWHVGASFDGSLGGVSQGDSFEKAKMESSGVYATFKISKKESLPSNQIGKKIPVDIQVFPAKMSYVSIPKESENVYIQAEAENKGEYPLLPGKLCVFHDSDYIGISDLPGTVPNEPIKVYLGIDENIKISREKIKEFTESKGLTGGQTRITYQYQIDVQSFKDEPVPLTLLERIPVSKNSDLKVKVEETNPEYEELDEKGILKWALEIDPKEKKEIELSYSVEYPKDKTVIGL